VGKLLEVVMAKRLAYYAEAYEILPDTQFGRWPGRATEQALLVVAKPEHRGGQSIETC